MTNPSPTSKEDIESQLHDAICDNVFAESGEIYGYTKAVNDCMGILLGHSKQQAIAFAEWTQKNFYEQDDEGLWYKWANRSKESDQSYTTEELYNLFITNQ